MATTKSAQLCDAHTPLELICGKKRTQVEVVFETYGTLSASRDNAILVNHALTTNTLANLRSR